MNNFISTYGIGGINNQYNARIDHRFSDKDSLFGRYTHWSAETTPTTLGERIRRVKVRLA